MNSMTQEGGFALVGFDQCHLPVWVVFERQDRDHQTRQAAAAANVDPMPAWQVGKFEKLC